MESTHTPAVSDHSAMAGDSSESDDSLTARNIDWPGIRVVLGISPREAQIIEHVFKSHKVSRIAEEMGLSIGTVKTYLQRIHRKLGISTHVQLVLKVTDAQLRLSGSLGIAS